MLTRYACTVAELSCVIGNIFAELSPPCAACGAEVLQITENNLKETLIFDRLADGAEKLGIMRKFPRLPPSFFSTAARFFACNRFFHTL